MNYEWMTQVDPTEAEVILNEAKVDDHTGIMRKQIPNQLESSTDSDDIYSEVTEWIINSIKAGTASGDWQMPWHHLGQPRNIDSGNYTSPINILLLWNWAQKNQFEANIWGTEKQWIKKGYNVIEHEKLRPSMIVKFKKFVKYIEDGMDAEERMRIGNEKTIEKVIIYPSGKYPVYNAVQIENFKFEQELKNPVQVVENAKFFIDSTHADIRYGHNDAFYDPDNDFIGMPKQEMFILTDGSNITENFYATILHELIHWTGSPNRCKRNFGSSFEDEVYAFEELIAELGAAYLCSELEVTLTPRIDHARYMNHWLRILGRDVKAIFRATESARIACKFLKKLQNNST